MMSPLLLICPGIVFASGCFASASAYAAETSNTVEIISEAVKSVGDNVEETAIKVIKKLTPPKTSRENRSESTITILWNPMSFALPLPATGFQVGYLFNEEWSLEPEYQSGAYEVSFPIAEIGKIDEKIYLLPFRWYSGNSFNLKFGLSHRKLGVEIGDSLLASLNREMLHLNLVNISSYNLNFGVGNRWQFENGITLGADWFDINIPVITSMDEQVSKFLSNSNDKKTLEKAINLLRYFPPVTFLKFQIGYTF
jgi:hypothetical protein